MRQRPVACTVTLNDRWLHTRQVVAGFVLLARQGRIVLSSTRSRGESKVHGAPALEALIDGVNVIYDLRDGYNFPPDDQYDPDRFHRDLESIGWCFRRSYDPLCHANYPNGWKVRPLGLNYFVSARGMWPRYLERPLDWRRPIWLLLGSEPTVRKLQQPPKATTSGTVLFSARTWNPDDVSSAQQLDRAILNEFRAACIRAGRKYFPGRFEGGFAPDKFTAHNYGDCLLRDARSSRKASYLDRMRRAEVCVATAGLFGSIGWKLGEYVACSKAIVSEPLRYVLPGEFLPTVNYLPFSTVDEFIDAVSTLVESPDQRRRMQAVNWDYYNEFVRPDALVWRTIQHVLESRLT